MKKRIRGMLLVLILLLCQMMPVHASGFNQEARNSVVMILEQIVMDGEMLGYGTGTGFFIGEPGKDPEYLVTNYHVIELFEAVGGGKSESSLWALFDSSDEEEVYVVDYDENKDLALLRLNRPTDKRQPLPLRIAESDAVGSKVYAIGFPGVADAAVTSVSMYGNEDATVTSGSISRLVTESGTGRRILQMDATIHGGNSGGPLVDEEGNVVGINTFSVAQDGVTVEGMHYAVSVEELIPLLERNQVAYAMAKEGPAFNVLLVVGAAVALVIVVAVVIIMILAGKKKKTKTDQQAVPAGHRETPGQQARRPVLYSMAPQHGGMRVLLDGQALLGRASDCRIVFAEGTPGVSGRHCSISWNEASGEFLLTDLRSTYGTFLSGGQRLAAGMVCRLKPGESFYLGDRANMIRVELE